MKKVHIIGIGMGNKETLTFQAKRAIEGCAVLAGAERMVENFLTQGQKSHHAIMPEALMSLIEEETSTEIGILMSGDLGFFSGAKKLRLLIEKKYGSKDGNDKVHITYIPGISSLTYFATALGISWEDAKIISLHGREGELISGVLGSNKTFFLADSSENTPGNICKELTKLGLGEAKVFVGERLSYENEKITEGKAKELADAHFDSLSVVMVINEEKKTREKITLGIRDEAFHRGTVPMTKEEVRTLTVSKLNICKGDILYDVGAGTGSVSIEMALTCPEGKVYAIEVNPQALELIEKNKKEFGVKNLKIVDGLAPEALESLPPPNGAFIGGSKGNLNEILECLIEKNPNVRVIINAVALETLSEVTSAMKKYEFEDVEIVQISVAKAKKLGDYNLMLGQNPVFIISAQAKG